LSFLQRKETPLVSIITPSYNAERFIEETIKSVIAQSYANWELIICDDASTDRTRKIIAKWSDVDKRIRPIFFDKNQGVSSARNEAILSSKGEFLAFLDSDDIWLPEKLLRQVNTLLSRNAEFVICNYSFIDEGGNFLGKPIIVPSFITYNDLIKVNSIPCLTVVMSRRLVDGIKFKQIPHEDYAFWLQILREKRTRVVGLNENLASYRIVSKSRSSSKINAAKNIWLVYREEQLGFCQATLSFTHYLTINSFKHFVRRWGF
jgi:teichuronic acid biosynthesis glycosyltransferase TuaG